MKKYFIFLSLLLVVLCGCTQNKEEYLENKPNSNINTEIIKSGENKDQSGDVIKEDEIVSGDVKGESSRRNS